MSMVRANILLFGDVQGVTLRFMINTLVMKSKIVGYVENLKDGSVRIVCEADKPVIEKFIQDIRNMEGEQTIESYDVQYSESTGEFDTFEVKLGDINYEMIKSLTTAALQLGSINSALSMQTEILNKLNNGQDKINGTLDKLNNGQDKINGTLEKINGTLDKLNNGQDKINGTLEKINGTLEKINNGQDKANDKLDQLPDKIHNIFVAKLSRVEDEMRVMNDKFEKELEIIKARISDKAKAT